MDFLLIGHSRFARRRVIPALDGMRFSTVRVASRSSTDVTFRDYQRAIDEVPPGLVYVSLTNDAHALWVERSLERGHHVIVDKPAFTSLSDAERLVALARARGLVLAEALTYQFHPVIDELRAIVAEHQTVPNQVIASFTPPVPSDDYRHRRELGGGALLDTGPYFASLGRVLWGAEPEHVCVRVGVRSPENLDVAYAALADYAGGRTVVGQLGFATEYTNQVELLGPALAVTIPRVFSTPPDAVTEIRVRRRDQTTIRTVAAASAVRRFLDAVLDAIAAGDVDRFADPLLADARTLDRMRRSAQDP